MLKRALPENEPYSSPESVPPAPGLVWPATALKDES